MSRWKSEHDQALMLLESYAAELRADEPVEGFPDILLEDALEERKLHRGRHERWGLQAAAVFGRLRKQGLSGEELLVSTAKLVGAMPNPESVRQQLKELRRKAKRDLDEVTGRVPPTPSDRFLVSGEKSVLLAIAVVLDLIPRPKGF